jgi:uncharacterized protein (TIGR03435 family)
MRGASVVLGLTGLFLFARAAAHGQSPPKLEFDVASIRASEGPLPARTLRVCPTPTTCEKPPSPIQGGPGSTDPERMTFARLSVVSLLWTAFGVAKVDQITKVGSPPNWSTLEFSNGTKYDIVAKVPPGATKEETNEMLKNLLIERFGLVYHMEKREFAGYRVTVAKGVPQLSPAAAADGPLRTRPPGTCQPIDERGFPIFQPGYPNLSGGAVVRGVVHIAGRMVTTDDLAALLQGQLQVARVENATGLSDKFDFKLEYADQRFPGLVAGANGAPAAAASDPAPDLFTALEKQLGLRLEKVTVPADAVVIERLNQQPTDN